MEEGGTEVEDEVDTGPLLHHLKGSTEDSSAEVGTRVAETSLEAVGPGAEVTGLRNHRHLVLMVGNDLSEFLLDVFTTLWFTSETSKVDGGPVEITLLDEISWGFREEEETTTQDQSPCDLQSDRDSVRTGIETVLRSIIDARCEKKTNGDAKLVTRYQSTTNLLGANLGHVKNDSSRDKTYTETGDQTTSNEEADSGRDSLQDDTNNEDDTAENNSSSATEPIGKITSDQSTEEGTGGENRCD